MGIRDIYIDVYTHENGRKKKLWLFSFFFRIVRGAQI